LAGAGAPGPAATRARRLQTAVSPVLAPPGRGDGHALGVRARLLGSKPGMADGRHGGRSGCPPGPARRAVRRLLGILIGLLMLLAIGTAHRLVPDDERRMGSITTSGRLGERMDTGGFTITVE